jgi:hypothetical protein
MQIRAAAPAKRKLRHIFCLNLCCRAIHTGTAGAPLVAEFGSLTWYKYLASLRESSLTSGDTWKTEPPPPQTAPINPCDYILLCCGFESHIIGKSLYKVINQLNKICTAGLFTTMEKHSWEMLFFHLGTIYNKKIYDPLPFRHNT